MATAAGDNVRQLATLMNLTKPSWLIRFGAEFTVIVIGVIVALAFDEWRQRQADLHEERTYYQRLARDLAGDIGSWGTLLDFMDDKDAALERLQRWLDGEPGDADYPPGAIAADLAGAANYSGGIPPARSSTYQELLATGNIDLLSSEDFRARLLDYYFQIENGIRRIDSRTSGYDAIALRLAPRAVPQTADHYLRPDLSDKELEWIVNRARGEDLRPVIVAERNRVLFLEALVSRFLASAQSLHDFALEQMEN